MKNEKRLIDANAFFQEADKALFMGFNAEERKRNFLDMISAMLDNCPTVDAVEVVHGRWGKDEYNGWMRCDKCKDVYIEEGCLGNGKWNYCPNCGAKMDGGNEDVNL